jgi:DNA-binding IclR family transcriptional regulator
MSEPHVPPAELEAERAIAAAPRAGASAPMVERAFQLLGLLAEREGGLRLSDLARELGMSKGSAHGLLKSLERTGAVALEYDRRYVLGPRMYDLARAYVRGGGLLRLALPAMRRLAARSGATVFLGQIESDAVRIVERVDVPSETATLGVSARRGTRISLLAPATGRAVLASWPPARREQYLGQHPPPRFTARSITDRDAYLAAVEETARTGIGEECGEYLDGVNAVAAPIHGLGDGLAAVMWVVGFSSHFDAAALRRAGAALREEALAIERALGVG